MSTLREAAQQALEALEAIDEDPHGTHSFPALSNDAITALRAALAKQEEGRMEFNVKETVCAQCGSTNGAHSHDCPAAKAALAQEPVAYTGDVARRMHEAGMTFHLGMPHAAVMEQMTRFHDLVCAEASIRAAVAFATPPRREWQSLTEEEIRELSFHNQQTLWPRPDRSDVRATAIPFARAIEAALKERNT